MKIDLEEFARRVHQTSVDRGFHTEVGPTARGQWWIPLALLLINEEVGEATKEWRRNGESDAFVEELADIQIRLLDLACREEIGIRQFLDILIRKADDNEDRPHMHGGRRM